MSSDKPVNRRSFFRVGLRELLKPISAAIDPVEQALKQVASLEKIGKPVLPPPPTALSAPRRFPLTIVLRPPGALPEDKFLDACSRCGECVKVCPAQCIKIDPTRGNGAPFIEINDMPCVVCDGLWCMHKCPTGALVPTILVDIDMGTARWNETFCVRSKGEQCTICVDRCPLGTAAITLHEGKVKVIEEGCIGCGVCQHDCPTDPKSIIVIPKSARA